MGSEVLGERELRRLIEVGRSLVSELDREAVLQRLLEVACELTGARYAAIGVLDPSRRSLERFLTRGIDPEAHAAIGDLPRGRGVLGLLISEPRPIRLPRVAEHPRSFGFPPNHPPMDTFLGVPIMIRGQAWGNLYLTEKEGGGGFTEVDEQSAMVLGEWAAIAIDNARSVALERVRQRIAAAERERSRWARELHDETLQGLGALRMLLSSGLQREPDQFARSVQVVIERLGEEIEKLRGLITELRPAALDQFGLAAAIETLVDRLAATEGLDVVRDVSLGRDTGEREARLDAEVESTVYRVIQEALTNVAKHARAEQVRLVVAERGGRIEIEVADDGVGFEPADATEGLGILGMKERIELVGGTLAVEAAPGRGARMRAVIPISEIMVADGARAAATGAP